MNFGMAKRRPCKILYKLIFNYSWMNLWEGPETAQDYLKAVATKYQAIVEMQTRLANGSLTKSPICLANVFRPVTLLNALRQKTSRTSIFFRFFLRYFSKCRFE